MTAVRCGAVGEASSDDKAEMVATYVAPRIGMHNPAGSRFDAWRGPVGGDGGSIDPRPQGPEMRVVVVRASDPACANACPEWISAEGRIVTNTVADFASVLKALGRRKLPVFIHSAGGNLYAGVQIGQMLRTWGLDVAVTHRLRRLQAERRRCIAKKGPDGLKGMPSSSMAYCASACVYLIAGGKQRLIPCRSRIGAHEAVTLEHT